MDSILAYEVDSKRGGAAGEIIIRKSLQKAFDYFGVEYTIIQSDQAFERCNMNDYDIIILDPWTWAAKDFFGSKKLRGSGLNIPTNRFLTAFGSEWNTFLGHQNTDEWFNLLSKSKFLLGLGNPLLGPSAIDAISLGSAGIIEAILSTVAGHEDSSMSLYGIALMAFVDITGSVLVLKLWQFSKKRGPNGERLLSEKIKEMTYSIAIGYLMILLGIFLIMDSLNSFLAHDKPKEMSPMGVMISIFGATCGLGLAAYKYVVGKAVDSPVVVAGN
eukprot:gene19997-25969_t